MYQVYSQQRPGRPRWAMAASTLLLLLTVGFAWAVIQIKEQASRIALTESKLFSRGDLRCRLPAGWEISTGEDLPPRIVVSATEPAEGDRGGRKLYVFRGIPRNLALPSYDAVRNVGQIIQALVPHSAYKAAGPARIGPLPGWNVEGISVSPLGTGPEAYCLGRAAVAPSGHIVGLLLVIPEPVRREDMRLLDQVSDTIELLHVAAADQPEPVMQQAGIRFSPPAGARFFVESIPKLSRVQMIGGEALGLWSLDLFRVPLVGSRTPAALVTDFGLDLLSRTDLPDPVEAKQVGNREMAQLAISSDSRPSTLVACVKTDEHTAVFLLGRHEPEGGRALNQVCQLVARTAEVASYDGLVNISDAQASARRQLKEIVGQKLTSAWSVQPAAQRYVLGSPAVTWGGEVRSYEQLRQNGEVWWKVGMMMKLEVASVLKSESVESWLIRDDTAAHKSSFDLKAGSGLSVQYLEQREPQEDQVRRQLLVRPAGVRKVNTPVDDVYAPELVLMQAAAKMALAGDTAPAIFTATDTFPEDTVRWILVPLGRQSLPGGASGDKAAAVLLQRDYDPVPILLYFDESQTLVAINHDNAHWQILTSSSSREGVTE